MKRSFIWWPLLAVAWEFLFWSERPGLNYFLFTVLLMLILLLNHDGSWKRKPVRISGLLTLLASFMVLMHGPGWAVFANIISLLVFAVFVSEEKFRTFYHSLFHSILNLFLWPFACAGKWRSRASGKKKLRRFSFYFRIVILPVLITAVFMLLYAFGNPHFGKIFDGFFGWLDRITSDWSVFHFLFFIWGIYVCGTLLFQYRTGIENRDQQSDEMIRQRKKNRLFSGMIALRNEMKTGLVLLILLNLLLLVLNFFDLRRIWIDFVLPENFSLKKFVHEGTWILLISIFLSMLVLLWIFRGNMHFFRENKWLKRLSWCWIAQNIFLTFSLFKRNYEYIEWHGLAYGRIVVLFFLIASLAGLVLFWLKIRNGKSVFYMVRIHSAIVYLLIIFASLINWGKLIVRYNLNHPNVAQIDAGFYLQAGNDVLPILYEKEERIRIQIEAHRNNPVSWICYSFYDDFANSRNNNKWHFIYQQKKLSWLSWNLSEAEALKALQDK